MHPVSLQTSALIQESRDQVFALRVGTAPGTVGPRSLPGTSSNCGRTDEKCCKAREKRAFDS